MREKSVSLGLIVVAIALLGYSATRIALGSSETWIFLASFTALSLPLLFTRVRLAFELKAYAMDDVAIYAMAFITGSTLAPHWSTGAVAMFLASLIYEAFYLVLAIRARGWKNINKAMVFFHFTNPFAKVVFYFAAAAPYVWINHGAPFLGSSQNALALGACLLSYMFVTMTVDMADTWVRTRSVENLFDIYGTLLLHIAMMAPLSIVLALLWEYQRFTVLLLVVPIAILHASMQAVRSTLEEAQATITAMASALEERDRYTAGHSERVARYAGAVAHFMGMSRDDVLKVENAGRIHDLGKIDIPDAILRKPCGLDDDEYAVMKTHTERTLLYHHKYRRLGAQIPFGIAAMHHERFDGKGYVYGLSGDDIPLGARIISVADTWDAMTSDRPYRNGLGDEEGLKRLEAASGTQFDPLVVEAFLAAYAAGIISRVLEQWKAEESDRRAKEKAQGP